MASTKITIPYDEKDANLLKAEAQKQERSFSSYIQKVLSQHVTMMRLKIGVKKKRVGIKK